MAAPANRCNGPQDGASAVSPKAASLGVQHADIPWHVRSRCCRHRECSLRHAAAYAGCRGYSPTTARRTRYKFRHAGQVALDTGIDRALDSAGVDSLGRIVVAAKHGNDIWICRLTTSGSLDSTFASGGTYKWVGAAGAGGDPAGAITVD